VLPWIQISISYVDDSSDLVLLVFPANVFKLSIHFLDLSLHQMVILLHDKRIDFCGAVHVSSALEVCKSRQAQPTNFD
jgi:hypothetical protein